MKITIMSHPRVTSAFKWYGTSGFYSNGLHFYSAKKADIEVAHVLQEIGFKEFKNFNFYEEHGIQKVVFDVDPAAFIEIHQA